MSIKKSFSITLFVLLFACFSYSGCSAQEVYYSTKHFGLNANPCPYLRSALIGRKTAFSLRTDYNLSKTENTTSLYLDLSMPLVPEAVEFRVYGCVREFYQLTPEVAERRSMPKGLVQGNEGGDCYVQTSIRLLKEQNDSWKPNIILNSVLKTASSANHAKTRRFFDTSGYFFDLELGKDLYLLPFWKNTKLRLTALLGFMCWETTNSWQDDAYMYGCQLDFRNKSWLLSAHLSAYSGWMESKIPNYGDCPIVFRVQGAYRFFESFSMALAWEQGFRDFPFSQVSCQLTYHFPSEISFK